MQLSKDAAFNLLIAALGIISWFSGVTVVMMFCAGVLFRPALLTVWRRRWR
jgi:hypothetical protein